MMEERCILVDRDDKPIGSASKKECHLMTNINKGMLHRAFSVCLFNKKGELLLQRRSAAKITFPLRWTNTCCSHPLDTDSERVEKDYMGVKRAAQRKLGHELGLLESDVPVDSLHYLTRIHYLADSDGTIWGEHEIDHILFAQLDLRSDALNNLNLNEVDSVKWVTPDQLRQLFVDPKTKDYITPWFQMISETFLFGWWNALSTIIAQKGLNDAKVTAMIHRLTLDKAADSGKGDTAAAKTDSVASKAA